MKDNFTEQQREIVARKMGFDGPMQNFGDFLMSSPATATQYSAVASKLGQKAQGFAAGGMPQQAPVTKGPTAIFAEYMASKSDEDPKPLMQHITSQLKNQKAALMQDKNSVLFVDLASAKSIVTIFATTDVGPAVASSLSVFIKQVKALSIKKVYGVVENEELKQAYASNGFEIMNSDVSGTDWSAVLK